MKSTDNPFNIAIMKVDGRTVRNLRPVRTTDIMESSGQTLGPTDSLTDITLSWSGDSNLSSDFNPDGLFSVEIFGRVGERRRDQIFSYIDIHVPIFHPFIFRQLGKIKGLYTEIMAGNAYATFNSETQDFEAADELDGETGFAFFLKHWQKIKFKTTGSEQRALRIEVVEKYRDRATSDKVLVLPAGLRDIRRGSNNLLEADPINDIYRKIISLSNTVALTGEAPASPAHDYSRFQLQRAFNEVYETIETMLKDKGGFIQNKWAKRRVFHSTRNVISSMDTSKADLTDTKSARATDTILGIYQLAVGALPLTIHLLRNGWLSQAFDIGGSSPAAQLVNRKTWKRESVELDSVTKDRWTTIDGLTKVLNQLNDTERRREPIVIQGYHLGLIYKDDRYFKIFGDIDELPEGFDRDNVRPLTFIEWLYLSGYQRWNDLKGIITRYPVIGIGSSYPSDLYVKTTTTGHRREELDDEWQGLGEDFIAYECPNMDQASFSDSTVVSPVRMKGLDADFDGDQVSLLILYSDNSIEEININLHSRSAYVDAKGGLRTSVKTDTLALVIRNMTGNVATADY